ncbi:MAG: GDP-mannose 4,6-dehydratase [Thermoguttaceae bacterium]|jgi:GDPmannose 4,6-dehydratase
MKRHALITGVTGQDGAYLSRYLLEKDYVVFGLVPRSTRYAFANLDYLGVTGDVDFIDGDLADEASLIHAVRRTRPAEVYNLAAQSFVGMSWDQPMWTTDVNACGTLRLLEAVRNFAPAARFYQASTSEMFGNCNENGIQTEETPMHPCSPYAISKLYAYWIVNNYRTSYGMFCVNGILFNHESPIRGKEFVTRKISHNVAKIKLGLSTRFGLGNLESKRDWGFAGDYVEAMYRIVHHETPENFIISTGETHSVREFLELAFRHVGIESWEKHVYIDPAFKRPAELINLRGSSDKAKEKIGWQPKVTFEALVQMMVDADLERLKVGEIGQ